MLAASAALAACTDSADGGERSASAPPRPHSNSVLQATWTGYQLPAAVAGAAAVARGGQLIIAGGTGMGGKPVDSVVRLNPLIGRETMAGKLAQPVADGAAALIGGRIAVLGGLATKAVPAVQTPTARPGTSPAVIGRLPEPMSGLAAATVGNTTYLVGGATSTGPFPQVLRTTDGRHFSAFGHLPVPVSYPAAVVAGGALWVFGGLTSAGPSAVIQRIDLRAGHGAVAGRLPTPLAAGCALALRGRIFLAGGVTTAASAGGGSPSAGSDTATQSVLAFEPATGAIRQAGLLPLAVAHAACAVVRGVGYVIGGSDGSQPLPEVTALRLVPRGTAVPVGITASAAAGAQAATAGTASAARTARTASAPATAAAANGRTGGNPAIADRAAGKAGAAATTPVPSHPGGDGSGAGASSGPGGGSGASGPGGGSGAGRPPADPRGGLTPWLRPVRGPGHLARGSDPSALPADVLVADHLNNRLVIIDPQGRVRWAFPRPGDLRPGQSFRVPDDAFFSPDGRYIVATQEDNQVISVISVAQHKIVYRYGKPGRPGSGPNRLDNPDDAMMMPNGDIIAADIKNCRIIVIKPPEHRPLRVIGRTTNVCMHAPPHRFGSPNGVFPMAGGYVVTEINGDWADGMTLSGHVRWAANPPGILYPSDTNEVYPGCYLTADYSSPGQVAEFTSRGKLLWRFGGLNQPSLALPLPNGDVLVNDDFNDRIIVINPRSNRIVWQYGHTGVPGRRPGYLNDPDGLDLVPPDSFLIRHAPTMQQP